MVNMRRGGRRDLNILVLELARRIRKVMLPVHGAFRKNDLSLDEEYRADTPRLTGRGQREIR